MSRAREDFLVRLVTAGVPRDVVRQVLRLAATHTRLETARANADFPFNVHRDCHLPDCKCWKGELGRCANCEGSFPRVALSAHRSECGVCQAEYRLLQLLSIYGITPRFQGDGGGIMVTVELPGDTRTVPVPVDR